MELTRRDALAALAAVGVTGGALAFADRGNGPDSTDASTGPLDEGTLDALVAAADVLYPSAVTDSESFVTEYARGRAADDDAHATEVVEATTYLDDYANAWYDADFAALDPETRDEALRRMRADTADPDPDGTDVERVRYYVINDLLFALYTSPTGAELAGLENPPGYPGGRESYQRGPQS
ncbi:gluconate 2-dehydrogenase subunit 3 family protein [Halarchaeum salinum]|uniref:Gluconate 2-dehydrogenase subunit 3 family protein n=1 Tax=Halarchaeum salinum TaxID=489912 RepID=A0AAV3S4L5_9EURY